MRFRNCSINGEIMKIKLENIIKEFVREYPKNQDTKCKWGEPLITYADAENKEFYSLKKLVSPTHALPKDFLPNAKTVVAYFIPFDESITKSNINGRQCSKEWGIAYIETNKLIFDLNTFIMAELEKLGYKSNVIAATHNFDTKKLISDWSHRHVAVIAGLGTFGLNNMIITYENFVHAYKGRDAEFDEWYSTLVKFRQRKQFYLCSKHLGHDALSDAVTVRDCVFGSKCSAIRPTHD